MQQVIIATTEEHASWECRIVGQMSNKVVDSFRDKLGRIPNNSPVIADAYGQFPEIFLPVGDYVLALRSPDGKVGRSQPVSVPFVQVIP
jgi:hypothetical protein